MGSTFSGACSSQSQMNPEAQHWLIQNGFTPFERQLARIGVVTRDDMHRVQFQDLETMGMPAVTARRFQDLAARVPSAPPAGGAGGGVSDFADVSTVVANVVEPEGDSAGAVVAEAVVMDPSLDKKSGSGGGASPAAAEPPKGLRQLSGHGMSSMGSGVDGSGRRVGRGAAAAGEPRKVAKLLFLVDITASMGYAIKDVKARINEIVTKAEEQFSGISLHVGIIGYRDYSDDEQFVVHDFTSDKVAFVRCLSRMEAKGGGDTPEDVLGGMQKALSEPSWGDAKHRETQKTVAKIIFHIGDAPHHGPTEFHDPADRIKDNFPERSASPRPYREICQDLASSKIDYYFAQVKSNGGKGTVITHRMATKFKEAYDSCQGKSRAFTIVSLESYTPEKLFMQVLSGITTSITTAISGRM